MHLIDKLGYPNFVFGGADAETIIDRALDGDHLPPGQYAFASRRGKRIILGRDPLGCNKLFFGWDTKESLVVSNRIAALWRNGVALRNINSCPPGHLLSIADRHVETVFASDATGTIQDDPDFDIGDFHIGVAKSLRSAVKAIASGYADSRFVVCLSGGLDSSIVASFAAEQLDGVLAVSFTYLNDEDLRKYVDGTPVAELRSASDDFRSASAVADSLGLPLLPIVRPWQAVAAAAAPAVLLGQDWRDFNAHCATVNLFLAQGIREAFPAEQVVVFTGDLMNEFVCDYQEEILDGEHHYRIPKVPIRHRRKFFIRGLDAGDREIGIFGAYGLSVCQLFSSVYRAYLSVPPANLELPDAKRRLNASLLGKNVLANVGQSKVRAQVGGKDFGTLGIYRRLGIDQASLAKMWQSGFQGEAERDCQDLIVMGRYRQQPAP